MTASVVVSPLIRERAGDRPGPVVSRPIRLAARAAALTLVPSGLWRITLAFGVSVGFAEGDLLHADNFPSRWSLYLIGLSLFAELLGLLTLGLVQRWGEVLPDWVPLLGGRRIPVLAAVVPAGLGAAAVTLITTWGAWNWNQPQNMGHPNAPDGVAYWIMTACYAPLLLWGPLLAVVTIAYYRRRRHENRPGTAPSPRTGVGAALAVLAVLTVFAAAATTLATVAPAAGARPAVASVEGAADVRLTYQDDHDVRSFVFAARSAPYTRGPIPTADGRVLPGAPNDANGTVKITHHVPQWNLTFTAEGHVDSMVTAPGYATLTAVITTVSPGGPDYWIGKRFGFSVYDGGRDKPHRSRDRVGFSWEFMNLTRNEAGDWVEAEVGTSMAPAPFAPVVDGGYTVVHADLEPAPTA